MDVPTVNHGEASGVDAAAFLGDDPALALVTADLSAWVAAHPCECEALCECDGPPECVCLTYGRGLSLTRVNSPHCPVHGRKS